MFNLQQRKLILNEYLRVSYLKDDNQIFLLSTIAKERFKNWNWELIIDCIISHYINVDNLSKKEAHKKFNNKIQDWVCTYRMTN
tara:strand:+ start:1089 stop:1340 length:252 start_codon:yes stop_codon:yes gene_type:complete